MKRFLAVLFVAMIIVAAVSAKGFVGGTLAYEIGSMNLKYDNASDPDFDYNDFYLSLRGGHFFGKSARHGVIYSFGLGGVTKLEMDGTSYKSDAKGAVNTSVGYGYRLEIKSKQQSKSWLGKGAKSSKGNMDVIFGSGIGVVGISYDDDTITISNINFNVMSNYCLNEKISLLYGFDLNLLYNFDYSKSGFKNPDSSSGVSFMPFFGCSFCY